MKSYIDLYDLKVGDIFVDTALPNQKFKAVRWRKKDTGGLGVVDCLEAEYLIGAVKGNKCDFFYAKGYEAYAPALYKVLD